MQQKDLLKLKLFLLIIYILSNYSKYNIAHSICKYVLNNVIRYRNDRVNGVGGGVAIYVAYVRNNSSFQIIDLSHNIHQTQVNIYFGIRALPFSNVTRCVLWFLFTYIFFSSFEILLECITSANSHYIFMGEFNTFLLQCSQVILCVCSPIECYSPFS